MRQVWKPILSAGSINISNHSSHPNSYPNIVRTAVRDATLRYITSSHISFACLINFGAHAPLSRREVRYLASDLRGLHQDCPDQRWLLAYCLILGCICASLAKQKFMICGVMDPDTSVGSPNSIYLDASHWSPQSSKSLPNCVLSTRSGELFTNEILILIGFDDSLCNVGTAWTLAEYS